MFDNEKFHNQLALSLGYELIVKDMRFNIMRDDKGADVPKVMIEIVDTPVKIEFRPFETPSEVICKIFETSEIKDLGLVDEINTIINAVHIAYIESTKELATILASEL